MLRITTPCGDNELFERNDDVLVDFLRETIAGNGFSKQEMYNIIDDVKGLQVGCRLDVECGLGLVFTAEALPEKGE
ncbi:MAG TPA: hypothetical protein PKB13_07470 [Clostridia bacterium]|nr:hypothetical protein [Clostridia bacterium]